MTKNELDGRLDAVMQKYTKHIDENFHKIDIRYNWIIGLVITSALTILISIFFKMH